MKGQISKAIVWYAHRGILMFVFIVAAPVAFAGPYVGYDVSNLPEHTQVTRQFNQRFGFSSGLYRDDLLATPLFELQQEIDTVSLLSDWHPGHSLFRLSAGVLYQPESGKQEYRRPYHIPLYLPNIETGFSGLEVDGASPYVGLGWGNNLWQESKLGFNVDMGVLYQPDERLLDNQAAASFKETAKFPSNDFLQTLRDHELAPVFSMGVSYSF